MDAEKQSNAWRQIVVKAGADETFKKRLLANPSAVLKEHGLEIPPGCQVKIVEDSDKVVHLTLPAKSTTDELSDDELENVAGGTRRSGGSGPPVRTTIALTDEGGSASIN